MDGGRGRDTDRRRVGIRIGVVRVLPGGHHRSTEPSEEPGAAVDEAGWKSPDGRRDARRIPDRRVRCGIATPPCARCEVARETRDETGAETLSQRGERPTAAASSTANVMPRSALCRPCRSKRASSLVQDTAVSDQAGIAIGLADFVADGLIQCEFDSGDIEPVLHVVGAQNLDVVRKPCPS